MRLPMPSPRGTNFANLFISTNPKGAYDAMTDQEVAELLEFLKGKLSDSDFAEFCALGGFDAGMTMDEPAPFTGMPQPSGRQFGQDARRGALSTVSQTAFARRYPHAAAIKVRP